MKILIVRLSSLGDIVHTFPMITDIKKHFPESRIDWLTDQSFTGLVKIHPEIDNVIEIPLRAWLKSKFTLLKNFLQWKNSLPKTKYDYIIDAQGLFKSAVLTKVFSGPVYGLDKKSIKEKIATIFYHKHIYTGKNLLAIQKNRRLAANIFNYQLDENNVDFGLRQVSLPQDHNDNLHHHKLTDTALVNSTPQIMAEIFSQTNYDKYAIFFHATSLDAKKYPLENWVELAQYLITQHNLRIVLPYGNQKEKMESSAIKESFLLYQDFIIIPEEQMSYTKLVELISKSSFVFGVDTGLIHLANALNKKLIAIYVATNPDKTGVFASNIAKNLGNIGVIPKTAEIIASFEQILYI